MFDKFVFLTIFTKICMYLIKPIFFARNFKPPLNKYNYLFLAVLS